MTREILTIATLLSAVAASPLLAQAAERDVAGAAYYGVWCEYGEDAVYAPAHDSRTAAPGGVWRLAKQSGDLDQNEVLQELGALELVSGGGEVSPVDVAETFRSVTMPVPAGAPAGSSYLLRRAGLDGIVLNVAAPASTAPFVLEDAQWADPVPAGGCAAECRPADDPVFYVPRAAQVAITYRGGAAVADAFFDIAPAFGDATQRYVDTVLLPASEQSTTVTLKVSALTEDLASHDVTLRLRGADSDALLEELTLTGDLPQVEYDWASSDVTYSCDDYYGDYEGDYANCGCTSTSEAGLFGGMLGLLALARRRRR